jgi:Bacterial regulatory helix-turn-helix protein, lysR family
MDFRNLRSFYLISKYGTLLKAANYLKITLAAVSVQLKKLEDELRAKLFERHTNKLLLTEKDVFCSKKPTKFSRLLPECRLQWLTGENDTREN